MEVVGTAFQIWRFLQSGIGGRGCVRIGSPERQRRRQSVNHLFSPGEVKVKGEKDRQEPKVVSEPRSRRGIRGPSPNPRPPDRLGLAPTAIAIPSWA